MKPEQSLLPWETMRWCGLGFFLKLTLYNFVLFMFDIYVGLMTHRALTVIGVFACCWMQQSAVCQQKSLWLRGLALLMVVVSCSGSSELCGWWLVVVFVSGQYLWVYLNLSLLLDASDSLTRCS